MKTCYVYILLCRNGRYYAGVTNTPQKRIQDHRRRQGARYTRQHGVAEVSLLIEYPSKSEAMREEWRIKHQLSQKQKKQLIADRQSQTQENLRKNQIKVKDDPTDLC